MKLDIYLSPHKDQFQVDCRIKYTSKTMKQPLDNNKGEYIHDFGLGKDFLNRTQKALTTKEKIDKLDIIKIKNFSFIKRRH